MNGNFSWRIALRAVNISLKYMNCCLNALLLNSGHLAFRKQVPVFIEQKKITNCSRITLFPVDSSDSQSEKNYQFEYHPTVYEIHPFNPLQLEMIFIKILKFEL